MTVNSGRIWEGGAVVLKEAVRYNGSDRVKAHFWPNAVAQRAGKVKDIRLDAFGTPQATR